MSKRIAIVQSNYIPWKGYFDLIGQVDEFVLFDDMQYTRRDWRNRNQIKTATGLRWLTIPVKVTGRYYQRINETEISDPGWAEAHWQTIAHNYAHAPYFQQYREKLAALYRGAQDQLLSQVNYKFLTTLCDWLGIQTRLTWSTDYASQEGKTERLVSICRQAQADVYLSGPAARDYLEEGLFTAAGIRVEFMDYHGYPEYPQLFPPFTHQVSVLDLILNTGEAARQYLKSFRQAE